MRTTKEYLEDASGGEQECWFGEGECWPPLFTGINLDQNWIDDDDDDDDDVMNIRILQLRQYYILIIIL